MRRTSCLRIALSAALAGSVAGCQTESRNIPVMTLQQANRLPPSQLPRVFRDPSNPYGYPYNVHETDGFEFAILTIAPGGAASTSAATCDVSAWRSQKSFTTIWSPRVYNSSIARPGCWAQ